MLKIRAWFKLRFSNVTLLRYANVFLIEFSVVEQVNLIDNTSKFLSEIRT